MAIQLGYLPRIGWPTTAVAVGIALFLTIDLTFLTATGSKILNGGRLPLAVAGLIVMRAC